MNDRSDRTADDVRMRGFARRHTVEAAIAWLDERLPPRGTEVVPLGAAADRVLAAPVVAEVDVPGFDRATMDGFAVVAQDTEGATTYNPLPLAIVGDALPGKPFEGAVRTGQAVRIMTGAPMPAGCDAVLPAEWSEAVTSHDPDDPAAPRNRIAAVSTVSPGKHVGKRGEDIVSGTTLLSANRILRPQDLGVLSSVGVGEVQVYARPRVAMFVTGNELLPAGTHPAGYRIADANGPMLQALVARDGGVVVDFRLLADDERVIRDALHADADVILISGGSSVGIEDHAPTLLARHGELAIHGIAMRPSSPTGLGRMGEHLVFLLPGNPVSCLCAYDFFAGRAIRAIAGYPRSWPYREMKANLARKISSPIGRLDYARVQVIDGAVHPLSVGGASILSSTTRADGFVIVPADSEGFAAGSLVQVWLYA